MIHLDCENFFKDWKDNKICLKMRSILSKEISGYLYKFIWIIILFRISDRKWLINQKEGEDFVLYYVWMEDSRKGTFELKFWSRLFDLVDWFFFNACTWSVNEWNEKNRAWDVRYGRNLFASVSILRCRRINLITFDSKDKDGESQFKNMMNYF